jgi:hypothetical protein
MSMNVAGFYYITQRAIFEMEMQSIVHLTNVKASINRVAISGANLILVVANGVLCPMSIG